MSRALSNSLEAKLFVRLLKPPTATPSSLLRHVSAEPGSPPPEGHQIDEESVVTQAVEHILRTPDNDWTSSQDLHSLLLSSPPSPRLLSHITRRFPSSSQALSFFNYIQCNSPFSKDPQLLSYAFQSVLELASREPDSPNKLFELYQTYKGKDVPLTVNAAKLLIRCFGRAEMEEKSLLVYEELDSRIKNTHVRNVLIDVLLRAGRVDDALKMLDEMLQENSCFPPNEVTGDIVFYALLRKDPRGRIVSEEEIVGLVSRFTAHDVFPHPVWLTQLITRLCKNGKTGLAWDLLDDLMKLGAPVEAASCNALLTGFGRDGDVNRMNALLMKMKELDIRPDVVTFAILINSLCKLRRVDDALEVFEKMRGGKESDGIMVEADVITYNTLIDGLSKVGRREEALNLIQQMKSQKGCAPNIVTFNSLIDGFCRAGEIERAHELFNQMNEERIKPNVVTLNTMVGGMCRHGRINRAVQFFNEMRGKGLKGNAVTYTTLIHAFCDVNNINKAMDLFNEMSKAGCSADARVYYTLIAGLSQAGRLNDASTIVSKLKEAGFCVDLVCYNVLIAGFCRKKKLDKVYEMLQDMEENGVKPDCVTYNTIISFLSKAGEFKTAEKVMRKMVKEGLVPTVVTYGALIHAYCLNGNIDEAMKIFRDMGSKSKVAPNTVIYNILIDSLCKNNEVELALSLMDDMRVKEVKPTTTTFNAMFKGLQQKNMLEKAFELMDGMIKHACNPDYITMEILTEWLSAVDEMERLKKFVEGL